MTRTKTLRRSICCSVGLGSWLALGGISGAAATPQDETPGEEQGPACCEIWGERHDPETVRLEVARTGEGAWESATIYGDGVVVIDRRTQYRVDPLLVQRLLAMLEEAGFRDMEEMYGAGPKRVRARAKLTLGAYEKESVRILHGTDPEPLTGMIEALLKRLRPALEEGVGAENFEEGLRKIAGGELSPRTLRVVALHRPVAEKAAQESGWIVRVLDGWLEAERLGAGENRPRPVRRHDTDESIRDLAGALLAAQGWSLPGNLDARSYTQLSIEVLHHRHTVLARPFARRDRAAQEAERKRLNDLLAHLQELEASLHAGTTP